MSRLQLPAPPLAWIERQGKFSLALSHTQVIPIGCGAQRIHERPVSEIIAEVGDGQRVTE